jgi:hypothetical protein
MCAGFEVLGVMTCEKYYLWGRHNMSFDPEDGGAVFLRNVGCYTTDYTASYPRR